MGNGCICREGVYLSCDAMGSIPDTISRFYPLVFCVRLDGNTDIGPAERV